MTWRIVKVRLLHGSMSNNNNKQDLIREESIVPIGKDARLVANRLFDERNSGAI